jgi:hypothetical protein
MANNNKPMEELPLGSDSDGILGKSSIAVH